MRVNVYAEELTNKIEIVSKRIDGKTFIGIRFFLELPMTLHGGGTERGAFIHRKGDNDSAAVTFWTNDKMNLSNLFQEALTRIALDG